MIKRMGLLLFTVLLLPWLGLRAMAAEETGTIHVTVQSGGQAVTGGAVTLYRVGEPLSGGYRIVEDFGGGIVRQEDALSPHLAKWLAELREEEGTPYGLDENGSVEFSGLEAGLYLVVQTAADGECYVFSPFLAELPYEGRWQLSICPEARKLITEAPPTGQHPAPILGAMGMVITGVGLSLCVGGKKKEK